MLGLQPEINPELSNIRWTAEVVRGHHVVMFQKHTELVSPSGM